MAKRTLFTEDDQAAADKRAEEAADELSRVERFLENQRAARVQAQDSVTDQLKRLVQIANREGLYDAADWITVRLEEQ